MKILNIAFYQFLNIPHYANLKKPILERCHELALKGTILLTPEGINGFLAGTEPEILEFQNFIAALDPVFSSLTYKNSWSEKIPFSQMLVKLKKEIIAFRVQGLDPARETGKRLAPVDLKKWYDEKKDFLIIDTRNEYETSVGTFKNAIDYKIEKFTQFPALLEKEREKLLNKPVVMFCTGGIRCEKATALALKLGIKDVYQLEGGILKYFEEVGSAHYEGDCFVFDHRVAVTPKLEPNPENKNIRKSYQAYLQALHE